MTIPMAPDVRVSNSADFDADALLSAMAAQGCTAQVLGLAFLEFARWRADWSPPTGLQVRAATKRPGPGTDAWRRKHFRKAGA